MMLQEKKQKTSNTWNSYEKNPQIYGLAIRYQSKGLKQIPCSDTGVGG